MCLHKLHFLLIWKFFWRRSCNCWTFKNKCVYSMSTLVCTLVCSSKKQIMKLHLDAYIMQTGSECSHMVQHWNIKTTMFNLSDSKCGVIVGVRCGGSSVSRDQDFHSLMFTENGVMKKTSCWQLVLEASVVFILDGVAIWFSEDTQCCSGKSLLYL